MEKLYYYSDGNEKYGPIPVSELGQANISPNTLVWCEGMRDWQFARERADLLHLFNKSYTPPETITPAIHQLEKVDYKRPRILFILMLLAGFVSMIGIYGVMFNSLSETELLNISLFWIIPFLFGLVGLFSIGAKSRNPIRVSLIVTGILVGVLFLLFISLWSSL